MRKVNLTLCWVVVGNKPFQCEWFVHYASLEIISLPSSGNDNIMFRFSSSIIEDNGRVPDVHLIPKKGKYIIHLFGSFSSIQTKIYLFPVLLAT